MKNLLKIFAVAILTVSSVASVVACGPINGENDNGDQYKYYGMNGKYFYNQQDAEQYFENDGSKKQENIDYNDIVSFNGQNYDSMNDLYQYISNNYDISVA